MSEDFGSLTATRKTDEERFLAEGKLLNFRLLDFWQWMGSDLVGNTFRGVVAEYLVARALGVAEGIRPEWHPFDVRSVDGVEIEVKSCAYLQSWQQLRPSAVSFGIRPTLAWDPATNKFASESRRQAKVYVFALLKHLEKATLNPMDVAQWQFYVLAAERLPGCKQLSLRTLEALDPILATYEELPSAVRRAVPQIAISEVP